MILTILSFWNMGPYSVLIRLACLCVIMAAVGAAGCGGPSSLVPSSVGTMRVESLAESRVALTGCMQTSLYSDANEVETTFILTDATFDDILRGKVSRGQIIHIELLWLPKPGRTSISSDATNASIRYVVVADGEVGVYAGAGFALPQGTIGRKNLTVALQDASLKLVERTPGFVDHLTPARLSGTFAAIYDPRKTRQAHYAMSQIVTDAIGRSMFIHAHDLQTERLVKHR